MVEVGDAFGNPLLVKHASNGQRAAVLRLLAWGADVNAKDKFGETALIASVNNGHGDIAELLLQRNADPSAADNCGRTTLHFIGTKIRGFEASEQEELAVHLLARGAAVNARASRTCRLETPLHFAARNGQLKVAVALLHHGADTRAFNTDGSTALHLACQNRDRNLAASLIQAGSHLNFGDRLGRTPLHISCKRQDIGLVQMLVRGGACVDRLDADGTNSLHLACEAENKQMLEFLLNHTGPTGVHAIVNATNARGDSPLRVAVRNKRFDHARMLLIAALFGM